MDAGTMPQWAQNSVNGKENFKDYILGTYDGIPKTPEWAAEVCGVSAEDIKKLADMYAKTKPAALKASWAPGRNAYGEQYNRMAAALQAMTGNIGVLGGCAEGVGKAWHAEGVAYPYDQWSNVWFSSIKSDRWAHIVLNYPDVTREEAGLWPRSDQYDGVVPNIRAVPQDNARSHAQVAQVVVLLVAPDLRVGDEDQVVLKHRPARQDQLATLLTAHQAFDPCRHRFSAISCQKIF